MDTSVLAIGKDKNAILNRLNHFVLQGGPEVWEYQEMDSLIDELADMKRSGELSDSDFFSMIEIFGEAFSNKTMQGFAYIKPYGYSGDFEVIEKMYDYAITKDDRLKKWDYFWQNHAAARAVRNRKSLFKEQLDSIFPNSMGTVLNLASGPCTELFEYLTDNYDCNLVFDCLDMDENAIQYAEEKTKAFSEKINFINENVFRFTPSKQYDLIWSAGLFDYFTDDVFTKLLERFKKSMSSKGVLLIGNFDTSNRSKNYMELMQWHLYHRSSDHLRNLAASVFDDNYTIEILKEDENVNLFLKVTSRV